MNKNKTINIGLFGLGTVGTGVAKILLNGSARLQKKTGLSFNLKKICVRSSKKRPSFVPAKLLTKNPSDLIGDPSIDIIVELIGGLHPAGEIISRSFIAGKNVVTANKALLAEKGDEVFGLAKKYSKSLGFEASVCGGIPIIQSIQKGLVSNDVTQIFGIVNGTCNYILSSMSDRHLDFGSALKQAQKKGYAETDPKLDIEGTDSAHKLAILARLAFDSAAPFKFIYTCGIKGLSITDIDYAKELGYAVKLLAIGKKSAEGLELRVHPTMLPLDHPLSGVRDAYNAVFIHADQAGDLLFYGRGAGMFPTASAVMSDIVDIAQKSLAGGDRRSFSGSGSVQKILPMDQIRSKYYLRFEVHDRPGVLGRIAQTLGRNEISILSVHQKESHTSRSVPVIILTYEAVEKNLMKALKEIDARKEVVEKTVVIRVER